MNQRITFCRVRGERSGWYIKVNGKRVGSVAVSARFSDRWCDDSDPRWFWYSRVGDVVFNSLDDGCPTTADEAKAAAKAWILKQLEAKP